MANRPKKALVSAEEACRTLGVKPQTLYAYVSRGMLSSEPGAKGRGSLYLRDEVESLRAKSRARAGHGPTAAGALRWGDPVLESSITLVQDGRLYYRGYGVDALVAGEMEFENVAELLWSGTLADRPVRWAVESKSSRAAGSETNASVARQVAGMLAARALADAFDGDESVDRTLVRARDATVSAARLLFGGKPSAVDSLAAAAARALVGKDLPEAVHALNAGLIASADHELNPSTFAARVAASTGADFYACAQAALAAFSGRKHGMSPFAAAQLVAGLKNEKEARDLVRHRLERRLDLPGFGHRLYPEGDPRVAHLLELARVLAKKRGGPVLRMQTHIDSLINAAAVADLPHANIDLGLVAVASALGLGPAGASSLFLVGRIAGWTAHILEQRQQDFMLRPRARYVGRAPVN